MTQKERFSAMLSKMLAVFQWAVHKKYGADKTDFAELYILMDLKLQEPGAFEEISDTLRKLGLNIEYEI